MLTKKDSITSGVIDYFRNALAAIGRHSRFGNEKYPPKNAPPGELRWSFDVSTEHADAIASHLAHRGEVDPETGYSHTVALAWRALALLETELVSQGAVPGRAVARSTYQEPEVIVETESGFIINLPPVSYDPDDIAHLNRYVEEHGTMGLPMRNGRTL